MNCKSNSRPIEAHNPYPEYFTDEASGIQVKNQDHVIWNMGETSGHARGVLETVGATNLHKGAALVKEAEARCRRIKQGS